MSQIILQGKQQALIRVAESRVAVLDAVASTKTCATRCADALPVSPVILLRVGAAVGVAASVLGAYAAFRNKKKAAEKKASKLATSSTSWLQFVIQAFGPALLPLLQHSLQKWSLKASDATSDKNLKF